jgi:hypothetical protein
MLKPAESPQPTATIEREKAPRGRPTSSIFLTHWDPGFYWPNVVPAPIQELALYVLMYDRVVVRAWELILNPTIAECLHKNQQDFDLLAELLSNGCVTLLTTNPKKYPSNIKSDPYIQPITARVEDQSKNRSFGGKKWAPEPWQRDLCRRFDEVVRLNMDCLIFARGYPKENLFARTLGNILANSNSYELSKI